MQLNFIINFLSLDTKLVTSAVYMESFSSEYFFLIQLFSDLISKVFAYKTAWYHEVFPIISLQPCVTNLLFLKGYLESTSSKLKQERDREKDRDRETETERQRQRQRETEREREREGERERWKGWHDKESFLKNNFFSNSACKVSKFVEIFSTSKSLSKKVASH